MFRPLCGAIGTRSNADVELEKKDNFELNLTGAKLAAMELPRANLTGVNLTAASFYPDNLSGKAYSKMDLLARANLPYVNLIKATLAGTNLTGTNLTGTNLSKAILVATNLTDASLSMAQGLIQDQLNDAEADSEHPPNGVDELRDAETGAPLEWHGGTPWWKHGIEDGP